MSTTTNHQSTRLEYGIRTYWKAKTVIMLVNWELKLIHEGILESSETSFNAPRVYSRFLNIYSVYSLGTNYLSSAISLRLVQLGIIFIFVFFRRLFVTLADAQDNVCSRYNRFTLVRRRGSAQARVKWWEVTVSKHRVISRRAHAFPNWKNSARWIIDNCFCERSSKCARS